MASRAAAESALTRASPSSSISVARSSGPAAGLTRSRRDGVLQLDHQHFVSATSHGVESNPGTLTPGTRHPLHTSHSTCESASAPTTCSRGILMELGSMKFLSLVFMLTTRCSPWTSTKAGHLACRPVAARTLSWAILKAFSASTASSWSLGSASANS